MLNPNLCLPIFWDKRYARYPKYIAMKITFVIPSFNLRGGIRVIAIYADLLRQKGHDVLVIAPQPTKKSLVKNIRYLLKFKKLPPKYIPKYDFFENLDVVYQTSARQAPIEDRDLPDADVVIATWWTTAEWVTNLSSSKGTKVYFIQGHDPFDTYYKARIEATYRLSMHKITVSQWLVDFLENDYGNTNVSLVPNSVDPKLFYAEPRSKQAVPTVGLMYSNVYYKGVDISLKAISIASQILPNLKLMVFSDRLPKEKLPLPEAQVDYRHRPPQSELKHIYASCDSWLFASRTEGFGLPILEAMACRTPVIATPAGAAPELLSTGGGLLVKAQDPEDMARAILKINQLSNSEWEKMSQTAYEMAMNYSWERASHLFERSLLSAQKDR